ncbi:MAG: hypothetical protein IPO73_09080 [Gemmatimonadetes bacterium]|nr:hypothetical protein [Gemmatimonadota bacterium]
MLTPRPLLVAAALLTMPAAAQAQHIVADIGIQQGPVSGHVVIGSPGYVRPRAHIEIRPVYHPSPAARTVVVYRQSYGRDWYHRRGYRTVRVWYDGDRDRYYDRYDERCAGLREVEVYEHDGRYVRDDARNDYRDRVRDAGQRRRIRERYDDDDRERR